MTTLTVNNIMLHIEADPEKPLLWVLRDELNLKGTKYGCGVGVCGSCMVLIDGEPNHACILPLGEVGKRKVTTIEGLHEGHPLIQAWIAEQAPQCGYCQPAQIMASAALLKKSPQPTDAEIDEALSGVYCRCGAYQRIRRAVHTANRTHEEKPQPVLLPQLLDTLPKDAGVAFNEWIWINFENTVTLMINHSEMGQGSLTGLAMLFAEELDLNPGQLRTVFAPVKAGYENGLWGRQFSGGSSSIRGEWNRFREVAAKTRARLVAAAANQWRVAPEQCGTCDGKVIHPGGKLHIPYGLLAEAASHIKPPHHAPLKSPGKFKLIGKPLPRLDIPAMALGRIRYGIDVTVPGMVVATVARCPVFGGRATSYDDSVALAIPGVRRVIPIESGIAVVADNFWSAQKGREALNIEWDPGKHVRLDNDAIERGLLQALKEPGALADHRGDDKHALERAPQVLKAVYQTPYLAHATMEPMNCVAHVTGKSCHIWVGTQHQSDSQKAAAEICGLREDQVHVHTQFLGGGFGRRLETDFVAEAVELSGKLHLPVQIIWTRADDMQHDFYRPAHVALFQASLNHGGLPAAWFMRLAGPDMALGGVDLPYAIPNMRIEHVEADTPIPVGAWRSVAASNNGFVIESFMDELAHAAGRDPLEYRLALLADAPRYGAVLRLAAEKSNWGLPLGPGRGRGVALYGSFGGIVAQVAEITVTDNKIRVDRVVCAIDCGIAVAPDAVRSQMEGGIAFGLSAALHEEIHIEEGRVKETSFKDYPLLTMAEMPLVEVHIMPSEEEPGGVGEPGVPVIAPAVANAVFAATGQRLRRLPLRLA